MQSNTPEIIEGNKFIAEFMQEQDIPALFPTEPFVTEVRISYKQIEDLENQGAMVRLWYHDNWNKLMPVVEKIEAIGASVHVQNELCYITCNHLRPRFTINVLSDDNKIDAIYQSVIQFIKWYNNQNK